MGNLMGRINQIESYVEGLRETFPDLKVVRMTNGAEPTRYIHLYTDYGEFGADVYADITTIRGKLKCRIGAEIFSYNLFEKSLNVSSDGNEVFENLNNALGEIRKRGLDTAISLLEGDNRIRFSERRLWVN